MAGSGGECFKKKKKSAVGKAGGRVEGGLGSVLEALHAHSPVRTPSSGDASRGPRQTAGNSTFPALCYTRLPRSLSSPSPRSQRFLLKNPDAAGENRVPPVVTCTAGQSATRPFLFPSPL